MPQEVGYKELSLLSFGVGVLGLALALPGYLKDWGEWKVCNTYFGIQNCESRPYELDDQRAPKSKPEMIYFGSPFLKSLGIAIACGSFPLAAYAAREMAEIAEYNETLEATNKLASLQNQMQRSAIDNKVDADSYEAMRSIEEADKVDRFRETFFSTVTFDDMEELAKAEEENSKKLQQRRQMEWMPPQQDNNNPTVETQAESVKHDGGLSPHAQGLLEYLVTKELKSISHRDAYHNISFGEAGKKSKISAEEMKAAMLELEQFGEGEFKSGVFTRFI